MGHDLQFCSKPTIPLRYNTSLAELLTALQFTSSIYDPFNTQLRPFVMFFLRHINIHVQLKDISVCFQII